MTNGGGGANNGHRCVGNSQWRHVKGKDMSAFVRMVAVVWAVGICVGCASKAEFQKVSEASSQMKSEIATLRAELGSVKQRAEASAKASQQARQKILSELGAIRGQLRPLVGLDKLVKGLDKAVDQTNKAFVKSLRIQGAGARAQAEQMAALIREIEKALSPPAMKTEAAPKPAPRQAPAPVAQPKKAPAKPQPKAASAPDQPMAPVKPAQGK